MVPGADDMYIRKLSAKRERSDQSPVGASGDAAPYRKKPSESSLQNGNAPIKVPWERRGRSSLSEKPNRKLSAKRERSDQSPVGASGDAAPYRKNPSESSLQNGNAPIKVPWGRRGAAPYRKKPSESSLQNGNAPIKVPCGHPGTQLLIGKNHPKVLCRTGTLRSKSREGVGGAAPYRKKPSESSPQNGNGPIKVPWGCRGLQLLIGKNHPKALRKTGTVRSKSRVGIRGRSSLSEKPIRKLSAERERSDQSPVGVSGAAASYREKTQLKALCKTGTVRSKSREGVGGAAPYREKTRPKALCKTGTVRSKSRGGVGGAAPYREKTRPKALCRTGTLRPKSRGGIRGRSSLSEKPIRKLSAERERSDQSPVGVSGAARELAQRAALRLINPGAKGSLKETTKTAFAPAEH